MTKKKAEAQSNAVPMEAVPHLFNAEMLKWQRATFDGLKAIHDELVKLREAVEANGISSRTN